MAMKHFFVGVKAVITKGGTVLLVRGQGQRSFWDTPGGRIDDNESIMETLDRELHEELPNIESYQVERLLYAHRVNKDIEDNVSLVLVFWHVSNVIFDGKPQISEEHVEVAWIPITQALTDPEVSESVRAALELL